MKKLNSLSLFVIFSFSVLILYTITTQILTFLNPSADLSTLTTCFFAAFGGEVFTCALIKIFKLRGDSKDAADSSNNGIGDGASDSKLGPEWTGDGSTQEDA